MKKFLLFFTFITLTSSLDSRSMEIIQNDVPDDLQRRTTLYQIKNLSNANFLKVSGTGYGRGVAGLATDDKVTPEEVSKFLWSLEQVYIEGEPGAEKRPNGNFFFLRNVHSGKFLKGCDLDVGENSTAMASEGFGNPERRRHRWWSVNTLGENAYNIIHPHSGHFLQSSLTPSNSEFFDHDVFLGHQLPIQAIDTPSQIWQFVPVYISIND